VVVETATLLISEVVTNAVLHARTQICVSLDVTADLIRVEVADANPTFPWFSTRRTPDADVGQGLAVLQVVSSNWGVRKTPGGKIVWFELRDE
jgi:anti-sigma regulatory factor (Ser/Thr protein kinase)